LSITTAAGGTVWATASVAVKVSEEANAKRGHAEMRVESIKRK
jgi:hypothetical protein